MKVPKHIAIIMDGNRRFAKKIMAKPWKGHEWGKEKLKKTMEWCQELGIKELTVYAFSVQNFNRPKTEFDKIMQLFNEACDEIINDGELRKKGVKINFIGRLEMFSEELQKKMKKIMDMTKHNKKGVLNMAMAYGGREEVIDAVKKIGEKLKTGELHVEKINQESFSKELYTDSEPELIIRTGGDHRTSNFLIWQSHYSEWIFLEKTWPEFEKEDLIKCVNDYSERERRFGH